jgi:hypothetical protein
MMNGLKRMQHRPPKPKAQKTDKRFNTYLPPDLDQAVRAKATQENISCSQVLRKAARAYFFTMNEGNSLN